MQAFANLFSHPMLRAGLALSGLGLCAWGVMRIALSQRQTDRCPAGMQSAGARCCGQGQALKDGACSGAAASCSSAQDADERGQCVGLFKPRGASRCLHAAYLLYAWDGERFTDVYEKVI